MDMPKKIEDMRIVSAIRDILRYNAELSKEQRRALLMELLSGEEDEHTLAVFLMFHTAPGRDLEKIVESNTSFAIVFREFMKEVRAGLWGNPEKT